MERKSRQTIFISIFALLMILGLFSVIYSAIDEEHDVMQYLAGSATFVIALLTITYVYITSRQLDVMTEQLNQIKVDRELQSQPLPWISSIDVVLERPRFYFSPPEDEYAVLSRYFVNFRLKNIGACPAVCVNIMGRMVVPRDGEDICFYSVASSIPALEEKEEYPSKGKEEGFHFADDNNGYLIEALREGDITKYPLVECRIIYRNILGGCFTLRNKYRVYPEKEFKDRVVKNWLGVVRAHSVKYKKEIDVLKKMADKDEKKWDKGFESLKAVVDKSILGKDIKIVPWPIPGEFKVDAISQGEYDKIASELSYGVHLAGSEVCWAIESKS